VPLGRRPSPPRRDQIRTAGLTFSERQHHHRREAHDEGKLIEAMCTAMENYTPKWDEYYLRPMAHAIAGLRRGSTFRIRKGEPWSPFVTSKARRGAEACIQEATEYIAGPLIAGHESGRVRRDRWVNFGSTRGPETAGNARSACAAEIAC
jgi:hypothetical protein